MIRAGILFIGRGLFTGKEDFAACGLNFLSTFLQQLKIKPMYCEVIDGNIESFKESYNRLYAKSDILIICMSPDLTLTSQTKSHLMKKLSIKEDYYVDPIIQLFHNYGGRVAADRLELTKLPRGAKPLKNTIGTVSGMYFEVPVKGRVYGEQLDFIKNLESEEKQAADEVDRAAGVKRRRKLKHKRPNFKTIITLPSSADEISKICQEELGPILKERFGIYCYSKVLHFYNTSESELRQAASEMFKNTKGCRFNIFTEIYRTGIKISSSNKDRRRTYVDECEAKLRIHFRDRFITEDDELLEEILVEKLGRNNLHITTAESCTGGLLAGQITSVPGSSKVFKEGVIAYDSQAKVQKLGVSQHSITRLGAVSEKVAAEMAHGIRQVTRADLAVSITGLAGPNGDGSKARVGEVYIAAQTRLGLKIKKFIFGGSREYVRMQAVASALIMGIQSADRLEKAEKIRKRSQTKENKTGKSIFRSK